MISRQMSFFNLSIAVIMCMMLLFSGCKKKSETPTSDISSSKPVSTGTSSSQPDNTKNDPTGLSSDMISPPQVKVNGIIYVYHYNGKRERLTDEYEIIGTVTEVNDYEIPKDDFCAGGGELNLRTGQEIYVYKQNDSVVAVRCEDGYYMFYKE